MIANPYGTNTTSLYIYFQTDTAAQASYTVYTEGYEDYSQTLNDGYTTEHEYLLTGIVPDVKNQIRLSLQNENGEETGNTTELIDLRTLLDDYFETLEVNGTADDPFDWIHINSIRMMDDDSVIISSRETSSIIKISQIYTEPTVDYIIGSSQFWEESGYDELVYTPVGEFSLNAGQHCVEYETSDDLEEGQYYLYFFNNNNATISTRDYDYSVDSNYDGTYSGVNGDESYYDKYLVDENTGTFELAERIPVTYSGYVSSVQHLGDNILIDSGSAFTAVELDENNEPIQTLVGTGDTWWYRVFKWEFN